MELKHKKRILFVITKSNFGGAQRYVYELATSLQKDRFDVAVAMGGSGDLKTMLENEGIKTYDIPHFARDINLVAEWRAFHELRSVILDFKPYILHLNSSKAGGTGAFLGRVLRVPLIVFTAHGWPFFESRNSIWRGIVWILSWCTALLSHRVILVSEHDRVHAHMPFVANKISVIRTSVSEFGMYNRETARARLYSAEEILAHHGDLWVVTVAEMTRNKNLIAGLRAMQFMNRYSARRVFYTLIGDGELKSEIEAFIRKHNLDGAVKLLGHVPDARKYLPAFDVFLLPSLKEGMPYAILEAGVAALPVIASDVGGIPEIVTDGVSGCLINPRSIESITDALRDFGTHPEHMRDFGQALQRTIHSEFSIDEMVRRTSEIYTSPITKW